jgi:fatty-acyl-CoA synthase
MSGSIPAPGEAVPPTCNAAALLRRNGRDPTIRDSPAVRFGDRTWTHLQYVAESMRWANLFLSFGDPSSGSTRRGVHVGVLLDNTPDYLFALGGAALSGSVVVGLNHTRKGEHLLRDCTHTNVDAIVTEPGHADDLAPIVGDLGIDADRLLVSNRYATPDEQAVGFGHDLDHALAEVSDCDPGLEPAPETIWALIFTSGTSSAPKAVICSQKRLLVTGTRMGMILDVAPDDVGYICMPLFHSNALMVGWAPSIVYGSSVALARRFSASGWLPDVRRYGATYFNYTGKPLSYLVGTPEHADDADNTLRVAFGNEGSPQVIDEFGRRFGVEVIDAFGATEGGLAINRDVPDRPGAMGQAGDTVRIVDEEANELPAARFDDAGRLLNADGCVGEIVNTAGAGPFEGYYNNDEATARTTRGGWFWSGDLGYLDEDRYLYFAGRNADWIRVDGENFPAGPIETVVSSHPDVVLAAVYGVPDVHAGDQAMAAMVMREGADFDPSSFALWLDGQESVGPKWRPRYVRVSPELPSTGTNKVVKRTLVHQKFRRDRIGDDMLWVRERGDDDYRPFTANDESELEAAFDASGRRQFWDL